MLLHVEKTNSFPFRVSDALVAARQKLGLSQLELGRRVGLPQMHISSIESGKVIPRFDTLLNLVRVLDRDLVLVPRELVPAVHALIRDSKGDVGEQPLYAISAEEEEVEDDAT